MNTYRTTSPRVRGRVAAVAMAALLLSGLGSAPQALATPHVPEPGRDHGGQVVRWLSVGQLRREAAADRAQHLRWAGGVEVAVAQPGDPRVLGGACRGPHARLGCRQ